MKQIFIITLLLLFTVQIAFAQIGRTVLDKQSEELGKVRWYRDYDQALLAAKRQNKPVLLLFQEVPGCATCRNYGHQVLSHPLMVEAIENLFVPLAIFNNKGGKDKIILKKYNEPTWNNPVVRILNMTGDNLIPRIASDYSAITLCRKMQEVLAQEKTNIPAYLNLLEAELAAATNVKEAYFKMYCFWSGEKELGKVEGVLHTESGFMKGSEVVKVKYDPNVVSSKVLLTYAEEQNFKPIKRNNSYRMAAKDLHYYLQNSNYKYLPLTDLQKTKINSALGSNENAKRYLSPKQLQWLQQIKSNASNRTILFDKAFKEAWTEAVQKL